MADDPKAKAPPVPTGIQRLLRLAAADEPFRVLLLERRDAVAAAAGVVLTDTERAVLRAASEAQLDTMAKHLPAAPSPRREFFRQTAATAAALIAGPVLLSLEGCEPEPVRSTAGVRPDLPPPPPPSTSDGEFAEPPQEPEPDRPEHNEMQGYGGMAPDEPPPKRAPENNPVPAGIAPDVPPKR